MATSYTNRLRLTDQGNGDNPNTWGDIADTVFQLLEDSVAGVVDFSVTGGNGTLTTANGSTDEARKMVINLTGTSSTNVTVTVPALEKVYVILNTATLSDGATVTIKPSGQSGVSFANGISGVVVCDGTDVIEIVKTAAGALAQLDTVGTAQIDDGAVTTDKIADGAVTADKLAEGAAFITGMLMMWSTGTPPTGWLICDGSAVSRDTYSGLFSVIGTTNGAGDGSTTFNLPDGTRRSPLGAGGTGTDVVGNTLGSVGGTETHTLTISEMPAHTHSTGIRQSSNIEGFGSGNPLNGYARDGTSGSTGGDAAHNNMHPVFVINYIIKT
jgi:microcystin-dependent protein